MSREESWLQHRALAPRAAKPGRCRPVAERQRCPGTKAVVMAQQTSQMAQLHRPQWFQLVNRR